MKSTKTILFALAFGTAFAVGCSANTSPSPSETSGTASASVGNEGANGGRFEAQQMAVLAGEMVIAVKLAPQIFPEVDIAKLQNAVEQTRLFFEPQVIVNGLEVDASNNGRDEITVNYNRWAAKTDRLAKMALLFHEYLGIMGLERNAYGISNRLLNPLNSLTSETAFECNDPYYSRITVRYDVTSDLYFFTYGAVDEAKISQWCVPAPGTTRDCSVKDVLYRSKAMWYELFRNELKPVRRKDGDKLVRIDPSNTLPVNFSRMRFLDGQGIILSTESVHIACYPLLTK